MRSPILLILLGVVLGVALAAGYVWTVLDGTYSRHIAGEQGDGRRADENTSPEQHGTLTHPIVVEIAPTLEDRAKARQNAEDEHAKANRERHILIATWIVAAASVFLAVGTTFLAGYTFNLWRATADLAEEPLRAARRVRSVIRGAGMPTTITNIATGRRGFDRGQFVIQAYNHGTGLAVINRVRWKFAGLNDFTTPYRPQDNAFLGLVIAVGEKDQTMRIVDVPAAFRGQMIVFRFEYSDVNRGRDAVIEHAMQLDAPGMNGLPVFVETQLGVLEDDFRIEIGPLSYGLTA